MFLYVGVSVCAGRSCTQSACFAQAKLLALSVASKSTRSCGQRFLLFKRRWYAAHSGRCVEELISSSIGTKAPSLHATIVVLSIFGPAAVVAAAVDSFFKPAAPGGAVVGVAAAAFVAGASSGGLVVVVVVVVAVVVAFEDPSPVNGS